MGRAFMSNLFGGRGKMGLQRQALVTVALVLFSAALPDAQLLTNVQPLPRAATSRPILDTAKRALAESMSTFEPAARPQSTKAPTRRRSKTRIALGAAAGAAGGFFAGGFLGATISGQCDCDDPGFLGFLIGAPIGAVAGGFAGGKWLF